MTTIQPFHLKHILIPIDFSETSLLALEHAAFMAKLFKTEITLVHVVETYTFKVQLPEYSFDEKKNISGIIQTKLEELASAIKNQNTGKVSIVVKTGRIAKKIVEAAKELNVDLIILGTHGVSGFEEFFMGSNAYKVVTAAPCPVISVQTHAKRVGFKDILLPIDNTRHSLEKVRYAVEIAKHYGSRIHILEILNSTDEDVKRKLNLKVEQVKEYIQDHELTYETNVIHEKNVATVTLEYAKKIKADLIVIMTDQEDDLTGFFLGPYAQQIVNHSEIPVMSVKPMAPAEGYSMPMFTSST